MKLKKFNYIDGKGSRMFLYGFIMCAVLMILINLFFSHAKYLNKESIKLAEGNISYKPYDFKIMAMYQENDDSTYSEIEKMPTSGYVINEEKSYCTIDNVNKDSNVILKTIDNNHTFSNLSKNDKCYLYFDVKRYDCKGLACETIMANMPTVTTRSSFNSVVTTSTTGTIYTAPDDYGTSYYFAGNPTDNWVKFAGLYWRIIRINGDGTIRMIYQGTAANTTGTGTQITESAFNSSYMDNMYVGYMYTSGQVHGRGTNSTIKGVLDNWYNSNLASQAGKIATGGGAAFCNDRTPYSGSGTGTAATDYAAYNRLKTNKAPTFKCTNSGDRIDTSIGLITADEVSYAGGVWATNNTSYYLYTNQYYWILSPFRFYSSGNASVFSVDSAGNLGWDYVYNKLAVRPVINLKADVQLTGSGTSAKPYTVK